MRVYAKGNISDKEKEKAEKFLKTLAKHNDRFIYFTSYNFDDPENLTPELIMHVRRPFDLLLMLCGELNMVSRAYTQGTPQKLLDVLSFFMSGNMKGMSNEQIKKYVESQLGELDQNVKNQIG